MSAIAGVYHCDGRPGADAALEPMMRALAALGPDRAASWHDRAIALGARQMMLVPEDRFDRQPWRARDGALVMVADSRVDNRDEVAHALGLAAGLRHEMSDAEMLLRGYERWGKGCLDRIVGEFTFAVWDVRERRLFCARSHLQGPPLYYHRSLRLFAFATTAAALFALPSVSRALDERRLACDLALVPSEAKTTLYRDILCLPPGHCLSFAGDDVAVERYWRLDVARRIRLASDADYVDSLRDKFQHAVAARLRAIHPVGSHLSSGCDSSAVTGTAARLLAEQNKTLTAFTAAPRAGYACGALGESTMDESPLAAGVAARLPNVTHVVLRSNGRTVLDMLDRNPLLYGRPVRNPANFVWIERILDKARERGIRVLLTGESGNMSISYHGLDGLAALCRTGHWIALVRAAAALRRRGFGRRGIIDRALGPFMPMPIWRWWQGQVEPRGVGLAAYSAINPAFAAELDVAAMARRRGRDINVRPHADGRVRRRAFFEANDGGDYRNGMLAGWGIETRDPTSDRRVVEFCLAIPENQFLRRGEMKFLYRRAFENVIPAAEIVARRRGYQEADWHEGLTNARAQLAAELDRLERSAQARRALDLPRLRRLVDAWPVGDWHRADVTQQYRLMLTRAIAAGLFIRALEAQPREAQAI